MARNDELMHYGIKGQKWGIRRFQNRNGTLTAAGKKRRNETTEKRENSGLKKALKTGTKVTAVLLVAYGTHKVLNNPELIDKGKQALKKMESSGNGVKNAVQSSTEYKIAKGVAGGVKKYGGKTADVLGNDKLGQAITGVGTMAVTGGLLRTQIKDLKAARDGEGDSLDKTLNVVKKASEIGESVNTLAKGPMRQTSRNTSKGGNELLKKTRDLKSVVGDPKGMRGAEDEKRYQNLFKNNPTDDQRALIKAMRKNGYSVDQIESYVFHSNMDYDSPFLIHSGELYAAIYLGIL